MSDRAYRLGWLKISYVFEKLPWAIFGPIPYGPRWPIWMKIVRRVLS